MRTPFFHFGFNTIFRLKIESTYFQSSDLHIFFWKQTNQNYTVNKENMSQINFCDLKRLNFTILNNYLLHTSKIGKEPILKYLIQGFSGGSMVQNRPVQEIRVYSLVQDDPTGCGATKLVRHNRWACQRGLCPGVQEPQPPSPRPAAGEAPERGLGTADRGAPACHNWRKPKKQWRPSTANK